MSTVSSTSAVLGRRTCAVVAAGSAALHVAMTGHAVSPVIGALTVAMAIVCLFCAYELWRGCQVRTWSVVAMMNLAMIAAHWSIPALMGLATTVSLAEAAVATVVLFVLTRRSATMALIQGSPPTG
jgi:hypothetical protein